MKSFAFFAGVGDAVSIDGADGVVIAAGGEGVADAVLKISFQADTQLISRADAARRGLRRLD